MSVRRVSVWRQQGWWGEMQTIYADLLAGFDADLDRGRSASGRAVAAVANPEAAWAAAMILRAGGSAVDAAVAAQAALTAVEPNASGLGGGAVILVADAGEVVAVEGLSAAPGRVAARLDRDFDGRAVPAERAAFGGRTVGVPGVLRALEVAHRRFGRLAWSELFAPAIALAEDGYRLSPYLLRALRESPAVQTDAFCRDLFCGADGRPLPAGTLLRNPELGRTLRAVARGGADAFYLGEIAQALCAAVAGDPFAGTITMADMAAYRARVRPPVRFGLGGLSVAAGCLPSFGGTGVGQIVGLAAAMGISGLGPMLSADEIHLLVEAGRVAFADRDAYAGEAAALDPQSFVDPTYLAGRAREIDPVRRGDRFRAGPELGGSMTSHLSIADARGQVVSMTTTINNNFGGRVASGGFLLNNVVTNFSVPPSMNALAPHRRARTTIAPCIVSDAAGRPVAAVGAGGGGRILGFVANALLRFAGGMGDPQAIVGCPQALNNAGQAEMEPPLDRHAAELARRGHWVLPRRLDGGTQMILRDGAGWLAGGDPRRDGIGVGVGVG